MVSTKNDQPKDSETHKPKKRDDIEKIIEKFEKHLDEKSCQLAKISSRCFSYLTIVSKIIRVRLK